MTGDIRLSLCRRQRRRHRPPQRREPLRLLLATYDTGDTFDQSLSKGFIELWSLPSKISARRDLRLG